MSDSSAVPPALSPKEWAGKTHWFQAFESWRDEEASKISGVGEVYAWGDQLLITSHEHNLHADFSAPADRHALAALCLWGTPQGFTQADVRELKRSALLLEDLGYITAASPPALRALASRIASLLPPEDTA